MQGASKPHWGLQAVNETREAARREVGTARGLGLHKTNVARAGEVQDLRGGVGHRQHHSTHSS